MSDLKTIPELVLHRVRASADKEAFSYPGESGWKPVTWRQFGDKVKEVAMGLRALGLQNEERVAIFAGTRFDWVVADMGILCGGGATTTIYPSTKPEDAAFIIQDSGTVYVFAETEEHVGKLTSQRAALPNVRKVITFDGKASADGWVMTYDELLAQGRRGSVDEYEKIAKSVRPDSLSVLIYTSSTTGKPKGVHVTHRCYADEAEAIDLLGIQTAIAATRVCSKTQARFGRRLRCFVCGSGPVARALGEFFHPADIRILEGYGVTETSAFTCVTRPDSFKFGTVGQPAPGTE